MVSENNQQNQPMEPVRTLKNPREWNRLLMQYGGIFKNNIKEFGDKVTKRHKKKVNYSR